MDVRLEDLIEKIKQEGVDAAQKQADDIVTQAKNQAKEIVDDANKEAMAIAKKAKDEAARFEKTAKSAVQQAARDTLLTIKEEVKNIFGNILKQKVDENLSPEILKNIIIGFAQNIAKGKGLDVLVSSDSQKQLNKMISKGLKEEFKKGITIKPDPRIKKGIRVGIKGEEAYYDITDEGITEFLRQFLSPQLSELIK
jgi:V/A-type H+-transporting ATPase subunit E